MKKLLIALVVMSSCAPVYVPNLRNSPMFEKGGEVQISGHIGNGYEGQAAVSVSKHIGFMGNYAYIDRTNVSTTGDEDTNYLRHKFFEGGIGYFDNDESMFMEIFAGYGRGEGNNANNFFGLEAASGKYERYFIQPAFGFNKKAMHFSFVPRVSVVDFTEFTNGSTTITVNERPKVFFEPGFVGRVNGMNNRFFFTFQAGFSISANGDLYFDHRWFQTGVGIGFRFGGFKPDEGESK
jgi:hypothetical protein